MIDIYTFSDKRPDFISYQSESFKRHIKDRYNFFVVNNSSSAHLSNIIEDECSKNGLQTLSTQKNHTNANYACWVPINYCIKNYIFSRNNISVIIDSDIFMTNDFSFLDYLGDNDISGVYQQRNNTDIEYIWNALVIINPSNFIRKSINIDFEPISPITDVGGKTLSIVRNSDVSIKWMRHTAEISCDNSSKVFRGYDYDKSFGFQIIEDSFLHYYRGSNWDRKSHDYHTEKTQCLKRVLENSPLVISEEFSKEFISTRAHSYKHWNGSLNNTVPQNYKISL